MRQAAGQGLGQGKCPLLVDSTGAPWPAEAARCGWQKGRVSTAGQQAELGRRSKAGTRGRSEMQSPSKARVAGSPSSGRPSQASDPAGGGSVDRRLRARGRACAPDPPPRCEPSSS
jgi:hypothetical protein